MGKDAATIRDQFQTRLAQIARELGAKSIPTVCPEAPSSRNWKPSPVPWGTRSLGN